MALSDEVKARYDGEELTNLTNPRNTVSEDIAHARLERACTAAESFFRTHAQQTFRLTDINHIEVAVELVMGVLSKWSGTRQNSASARFERAVEMAEALAGVTMRPRIIPITSSQTEHSVKSRPVRPDFDDERFEDVTPYPPSRDSRTDETS